MSYDPYRSARGFSRNRLPDHGFSMGANNTRVPPQHPGTIRDRDPRGPACGTPAPYPPGMNSDCPTSGITYCFSHLGGNLTAQAAGTFTIIITPTNVVEFVPRWCTIAFFNTGTSVQNENALINSVMIKGDDQLSGGPVGVNAFNQAQTVLEVNWRTVTPQNPITMSLTHALALAQDIRVVVAGDAYK
jgi:hypothetical protein